MQAKIRINAPHVVHDTIEGETILINLKNGNYYSFDKYGSFIWEILEKNGDPEILAIVISDIFNLEKEKTKSEIDIFISDLLMENLLVPENPDAVPVNSINRDEMEKLVRVRIEGFNTPVISKYSDMRDALMLDPIHDVDEKGWPTNNDE